MDGIKEETSVTSYSSFAKLLHWGFVILFVYGVIKQVDSITQLEDNALLRFEVLFAGAFLLLLAVRFAYVKKTQKSSLPKETPRIQKLAATLVHYGMYACLAGIAGSGLLIGFLYGQGFQSGLLIEMVIGVHEFSVSLIYWLIGMHILAAVYHRFLKDGVWNSMVPVFKEQNKES